MNTFGRLFRLTDFGESHGEAMGGVIDGFPAGIEIDTKFIQSELDRRSPNQHIHSTTRKESDRFQILSGVKNGISTGGPIGFIIQNEDGKQAEDTERHAIKPSHASYTYHKKYGFSDNEFFGRASARQTVCRVAAGAFAKIILQKHGIAIVASDAFSDREIPESDSMGTIVSCRITGLPKGLGEPVYDKFHARLGYAMLSINAAKGFEIGEGFNAAHMTGSQYNDTQDADFAFNTNHDGGVQAGITNGEDVTFRIAFKPIPTIGKPQQTIDFLGHPVTLDAKSRNDRSVSPRVLPVVEAMAAMVVLDFILINNALFHEK
ncbi:chorismate synthase [Bacteroidales bacterium OttesenSCG-928-B11]|nr:chorismate synthase [Bacteroidales bacterium OttesenSCG-928-E04]MDL2308557.1 chorismate synthase [Bacteroidales bacterium OttesenSCG-928-C03]MDL2311861.1 chorismate synthase [Bacteroidales bacterium OttesenSCG-928-B11]MDL2326527.1 chorismate synthase [Bacteroidales bacterium OttesenSCG-928-A14]